MSKKLAWFKDLSLMHISTDLSPAWLEHVTLFVMKYGAGLFLVIGIFLIVLNVIFLVLGIVILLKKSLRVTRSKTVVGKPAIMTGGLYTITGISGVLSFIFCIPITTPGTIGMILNVLIFLTLGFNLIGLITSLILSMVMIIKYARHVDIPEAVVFTK